MVAGIKKTERSCHPDKMSDKVENINTLSLIFRFWSD